MVWAHAHRVMEEDHDLVKVGVLYQGAEAGHDLDLLGRAKLEVDVGGPPLPHLVSLLGVLHVRLEAQVGQGPFLLV